MFDSQLNYKKKSNDALENHLVLLKFDGSLKDEKNRVSPVNAAGVTYDTTDFKLGSQSALWVENANFFTGAAIVLSGDYTLDTWVKLTPAAAAQANQAFAWTNQANNSYMMINIFSGNRSVGFMDNGSSGRASADGAVPYNEWVHLAWLKLNGLRWATVNGKMVTSKFSSTTPMSLTRLLGVNYSNSNQNGFIGKINQLALADRAKWPGDFTPPTEFYKS